MSETTEQVKKEMELRVGSKVTRVSLTGPIISVQDHKPYWTLSYLDDASQVLASQEYAVYWTAMQDLVTGRAAIPGRALIAR